LLGKHVETPAGVAQRPAPSIAATPAPPHASAAPVIPTTPVATPTPAAANPAQLTGAQTLGSGAADFTVSDLRYGAHPGDYRIVFDLTSGSSAGTPSVTVGFGDSTTLYVVFAGVSPGGIPPSPAPGGVVTSVTLLPHSPIPGHLVYEVKLSKTAKLSTAYLTGPVRLVIDLR